MTVVAPLALARRPSWAARSRTVLAAFVALLVVLVAGLARGESPRTLKAAGNKLAAELRHAAAGIETSLARDDVRAATRLYQLEAHSARLVLRAAALADPLERAAQGANLRALHGDVLRLQERVLDHTLRELDRALPGEPARDMWAREGLDLYRPLIRLETPVPGAPRPDRRTALAGMQQAFVDDGGDLRQIKWLGARTFAKLPGAELVEWVQLGERFRVTAAGAKHPIIAGGDADGPEVKSVRGAGSMMLYRDAHGAIAMAVVSNSSGNYKPGIGSVFGMVDKLVEMGVPRDHILETEVLPGEPALVKLLLKSKLTYSKEQITARIARLQTQASQPARRSAMPRRPHSSVRKEPTAHHAGTTLGRSASPRPGARPVQRVVRAVRSAVRHRAR